MNKETTEQRTAKAILQQPKEVVIRDKKYTIAPPSVATLILASEAISLLPAVKLDSDKIIEEVLFTAKGCRPLGDIVAIFLLGAKNITEQVVKKETRKHSTLFGLIKWETTENVTVTVDRKAALAEELLQELSPQEMYTLLASALTQMQIQDFFGLTTFLAEVNLLRPTKVVTETTAFGQ